MSLNQCDVDQHPKTVSSRKVIVGAMPRIYITEHIQAPPQAVWDLISDIRRGPEWVTVMLEVLHVSEGPIGKGSSYRELSKIGPSKSETEWTITEFNPPTVQVHESRGKELQAVLTLRVEPDGEGARFTHQTEYKMMPGFRPLGWLLETVFAHRMMKRAMPQSVKNAKQILEASGSGPDHE